MEVVALSVVLAALTWWFVERPWRGAAPPARLRHLAYAALPLTVLLALGALPFTLGGLPQRLPTAALQAAAEDVNPQRDACFHASLRARRTPNACRPRAPVQVLVWGDSHADAITPGVQEWAAVQGYAVQQSTAGGCPPLVDVRMSIVPGRPIHGCTRFNASVLREIAAASELKLIVLFARWSLYASARPDYDVNSPKMRMEDAKGAVGRVLPLDRALDRTLAAIAATGTKAKVLVIGPTPELPFVPVQVRRPQAPGSVSTSGPAGARPPTCHWPAAEWRRTTSTGRWRATPERPASGPRHGFAATGVAKPPTPAS